MVVLDHYVITCSLNFNGAADDLGVLVQPDLLLIATWGSLTTTVMVAIHGCVHQSYLIKQPIYEITSNAQVEALHKIFGSRV